MAKLKALSGDNLIKIFQTFSFSVQGQRGSHVKLRKILEGKKQTLVIPAHKELDKGTIKAIYTQALRYIPEKDLREYFYSE